MKRIYFTVTNDLVYDQRMQRICHSLAMEGYRVTLVGRRFGSSPPVEKQSYHQERLTCLFRSGPLFYAEYNTRLFFYLLFRKMDALCAIDLDTILPCLLASKVKNIPRVYDAHEFFTEMKEVRSRAPVLAFWKIVERFCVPRFQKGYTVSEGLKEIFSREYGRNYEVIRNLPRSRSVPEPGEKEVYLFYGGAVNEGRGFEWLIPAMRSIPHKLIIAGDGNFMQQVKHLIRAHGVGERITLTGMVSPSELHTLACKATLGLALSEKEGLNQYLALPNKFFDYIQAELPQIAPDFPEYRRINAEYPVAVLISTLEPAVISTTINDILKNKEKLAAMKRNCAQAKKVFSWEQEEKKLLAFYHQLFAHA